MLNYQRVAAIFLRPLIEMGSSWKPRSTPINHPIGGKQQKFQLGNHQKHHQAVEYDGLEMFIPIQKKTVLIALDSKK